MQSVLHRYCRFVIYHMYNICMQVLVLVWLTIFSSPSFSLLARAEALRAGNERGDGWGNNYEDIVEQVLLLGWDRKVVGAQ